MNMTYYVDKDNNVTGRLYQSGGSWVAETGRQSAVAMGGFIATKGIKSRNRKAAESFLFQNGCVNIAVA